MNRPRFFLAAVFALIFVGFACSLLARFTVSVDQRAQWLVEMDRSRDARELLWRDQSPMTMRRVLVLLKAMAPPALDVAAIPEARGLAGVTVPDRATYSLEDIRERLKNKPASPDDELLGEVHLSQQVVGALPPSQVDALLALAQKKVRYAKWLLAESAPDKWRESLPKSEVEAKHLATAFDASTELLFEESYDHLGQDDSHLETAFSRWFQSANRAAFESHLAMPGVVRHLECQFIGEYYYVQGRYLLALKYWFLGIFLDGSWLIWSLAAAGLVGWLAVILSLAEWRRDRGKKLAIAFGALALGFASLPITDLIISFEETRLGIVETDNPIRNLFFFVFGVGLREEFAKLLCFAPFLFLLRPLKKNRLEVVLAASGVALGFAIGENTLYFHSLPFINAIGRFATANLFHISMTAVAGAALCNLVLDFERESYRASKAILFVILAHGLYDFRIPVASGHSSMLGDLVALLPIVMLFWLVRMYLEEVNIARKGSMGMDVAPVFLAALFSVFFVCFCAAAFMSTPYIAFRVTLIGLLTSAFEAYVIVYQLRQLPR